MLATLEINVNDPMLTTMTNLAQIFRNAGWSVVVDNNSPVGDFTVTSPGKVGGNFPLVAKFVADTSSTNWERGVKLLLYRVTYPTPSQPVEFATTLITGGKYTLVINDYGFIIVPPEAQTHRFQFGTWAGLLLPFAPIYDIPPSQWKATPLFFTTDRVIGDKERSERHINPTKPTNLLQTPEGEIYSTFLVAHLSLGRATVLEKERRMHILPLIFCVEWGDYVIPYLMSPALFVEVHTQKVFYLPTESYKDFLKPRMTPWGRVVACGELPPQGAILLSLF